VEFQKTHFATYRPSKPTYLLSSRKNRKVRWPSKLKMMRTSKFRGLRMTEISRIPFPKRTLKKLPRISWNSRARPLRMIPRGKYLMTKMMK
jgi:hypothetical protein